MKSFQEILYEEEILKFNYFEANVAKCICGYRKVGKLSLTLSHNIRGCVCIHELKVGR